MDPFVGEIRLFPWDWVPNGWLPCQGQLLNINSYVALASLLGKRFGGDGINTFALPDLRGRVAMGVNPSTSVTPPLDLHPLAESSGSESVVLGPNMLPEHTHTAFASNAAGTIGPSGGFPATAATTAGAVAKQFTYVPMVDTSKHVALNTAVLPNTQYGVPNMQPSICLNFCIASTGVYPPHS